MNRKKSPDTILPHRTMGTVARQRRMGRSVYIILTVMMMLTVIPLVLNAEDKHKPEIHVQLRHSAIVTSAAYSLDGKYVVSGSWDTSLKLWDVSSGKEMRIFVGHSKPVDTVAFSSDGKYVLSGSQDNTIKLWDVSSGKEIKTFIGHSGIVSSVAFSPDGKYIASGSSHDTLKLWDVVSGKEIRTFIRPNEGVDSVVFSPDGKYIATCCSFDETISLWEVSSGNEIKTFTGHNAMILSVAFSPDGKYILSGSWDGTIKLWDITSGLQIKTFSKYAYARVNSVSFSPDGKSIIANSGRKATIWDIFTGKEIKTFPDCESEICSVSISPDGKYTMACDNDCNLIIWEISTSKEFRKLSLYPNRIQSLVLSPDGKYILSGYWNGSLKLWNISSAGLIKTIISHSKSVNSVAYSPDGKYVLSGSNDDTMKLWDITKGIEINNFTADDYAINSVSFSPDGKSILARSYKVLKLWKLDSLEEITTFNGHSDTISSVTYSPDGKYVLSGSNDKTIRLWDVARGIEVRSFIGHIEAISSIAYSPDGKYVLSGSNDKTIRLWDAASGIEVRSFIGHIEAISSVAYSPDGKYVLSGSNDKTIRLWDVASGKEVRSFIGHSGAISSITFSPDGKYVLSGSWDNTIKLWDTLTGKVIKSLFGNSFKVDLAVFSPDNRYIISSQSDGTTRIWNISTGAWVAFMSHSNGKDWLIFDSDGYWDASRHGGDLVAMVSGMDCWNIDQFAIENNRPDLILAKLPNADKNLISEYNRQYKKRIAKLEKLYGIKESDLTSDMHVPKAEILKAEQNGKNMSLSIKLTDSEYDIVSYNVYVNDVPVYPEIGKKIKRDDELSVTESIELTPGENKIEVSCFNEKGAESYRSLTLASYDGKQNGNLYFIGFGVADYADPTINDLKYSENDVNDLSKKFALMKKSYDNIYIKTYTGKEVTAENIKSAKDFVKNAAVDDTVILFISGHGMHDSDEFKTYYYLTQNTDMNNLKGTAADFETVEDILAGISPRKKLFLMDTCDSGELDDFAGKQMIAYDGKGNKGIPRTPKGIVVESGDKRGYFDRSRYIYNDLFRRTGAVVFSSSKGGEVSWEYDSLKNGAFTEAMLDGLSGKADKDKNGSVSIDELQEFVSKGVVKYTDDRQHPVIDRDNIYVKIELPVR